VKVSVDPTIEIVLGTLSEGKCDQMHLDLVFDRDFTISHNSKSSSVYICGYRTEAPEGNHLYVGCAPDVFLKRAAMIMQKDPVL